MLARRPVAVPSPRAPRPPGHSSPRRGQRVQPASGSQIQPGTGHGVGEAVTGRGQDGDVRGVLPDRRSLDGPGSARARPVCRSRHQAAPTRLRHSWDGGPGRRTTGRPSDRPVTCRLQAPASLSTGPRPPLPDTPVDRRCAAGPWGGLAATGLACPPRSSPRSGLDPTRHHVRPALATSTDAVNGRPAVPTYDPQDHSDPARGAVNAPVTCVNRGIRWSEPVLEDPGFRTETSGDGVSPELIGVSFAAAPADCDR